MQQIIECFAQNTLSGRKEDDKLEFMIFVWNGKNATAPTKVINVLKTGCDFE